MPRSIQRRDFTKEVSSVLCHVFAERPDEDLTPADIERLAQESGKLPRGWVGLVRDAAVGKELRRILRSKEFKNEHGDKVRQFHNYSEWKQTGDGKEKQGVFWRDIHSMNRRQMMLSYQARVAHARDAKQKAEIDREYWNAEVAPRLREKRIPESKKLF